MSRNQPLGPLQGFGAPQQTDLMRQLMEPAAMPPAPPPVAPRNVKSALKEFTSDLMFTLSQSLAASASAPGGRGTALGIAAAIAGPSQRRLLVQQQEDEKRQKELELQQKEAEFNAKMEMQAATIENMRREQIAAMMTPDLKEYGPWKAQQPEGADTSFTAFKAAMTKANTAEAEPEFERVQETQADGSTYEVLRPKQAGLVIGKVKPPEKARIDPLSPEGIAARLEFERGKPKPTASPAAEPLVAIIGPDGRPVYVSRSEAVGKTPASTREQGRPVGTSDANRIADLDTSLNDLKTLRGQIPEGATGTIAKIGTMMPNAVTELTGWTAPKQKQAVIDRVKQVIGKALEGGVLRKEDEYKYEKILPTIGDTAVIAKEKMDGLEAAIAQRRATTLDALEDAGYDVAAFRARAGNSGPGGDVITTPDGKKWRRNGNQMIEVQ